MSGDKGKWNTIEAAEARIEGKSKISTIDFTPAKKGGKSSVGGRKEKLGDLLAEEGVLDQAQLDKILAYQQKHRVPFGEAGKRLGLISDRDLSKAVAAQFGHAHVPADDTLLGKELAVARRPADPYAEAIRRLRTDLLATLTVKSPVVTVLSPEKADGRSHLVANLAVSFAQLGKQVLVVDADLRNPGIHRIFKIDNGCGLSVLVAGRNCDEPVHHVPYLKGLHILPAGPKAPNPQELIASESMKSLLASARQRYDLVLVDSPPTSVWADAEVLAALATTNIVLAKKNATSGRNLKKLVERLRRKKAEVFGCVFAS